MAGRLWSFRKILIVGYPVAILMTAMTILAATYLVAQDALRAAARDAMRGASDVVVAKLESFLNPAERVVETTTSLLASREIVWSDYNALERQFLAHLSAMDGVDGLYFATSKGDFVYVTRHDADGARYLSKFIGGAGGDRVARIRLRGSDFGPLDERRDETDLFDPRTRPWYAVATQTAGWTQPYIYYTALQPGVSFVKSVPCGADLLCVVGIDVSLAAMSDFLATLQVGMSGGAALITDDARLLAARGAEEAFRSVQRIGADPVLPPLSAFPDPLVVGAVSAMMQGDALATVQRTATFRRDGHVYLAALAPVRIADLPWFVATYVPQRDFFGWFEDLQSHAALAALVVALLATVLALLFSRWLTASLSRIEDRARAAATPEGPAPPSSSLREFRTIETAILDAFNERRKAEKTALVALEMSAHANQAKIDFLAHMNHELRTPLNAILGFLQLLQMQLAGSLGAREQSYLHDIDVAAHHLSDVIAAVIDIAAAEDGRLTLNESAVRVTDTLAAVCGILARSIEDKHLVLSVEADPALRLRADPVKLRQIVLNLLSNAVTYSGDGGTVVIRASVETHYVSLSVQDSGSGMTAEETRRALEPFSRIAANPYVAGSGGLGLGLTIARLLAELHGGTIALTSKPGVGTTASVRLPLERLHVTDPAGVEPA